MSKLYCVTLKYKYDESSTSYLSKRIAQRDGSVYCLFIQYAAVSSDREKLEKKINALRKKYPADLESAKIRPLTGAELASYNENTKEHSDYLERRKRQSCMTVILEEENNVVVFYTKKNLSMADRAALDLFRSLGFQVGDLKNGGKYAQRNLRISNGR